MGGNGDDDDGPGTALLSKAELRMSCPLSIALNNLDGKRISDELLHRLNLLDIHVQTRAVGSVQSSSGRRDDDQTSSFV